jgi:glycosyltransferase involved in cell wall biosynthesis
MRVLVISHGHPSLSVGGAEVASYNLHCGLNALPKCASTYLARVGHPVMRHRDTPFLSLRQEEGEILFHTSDYDPFRLSNRDIATVQRDFARFVADVAPDIVHFHHFLGLGLECILAARRARPSAPVVVTLHEYLAICHHHGQMVKTKKRTLCHRASPAECALCFPDISAGEFLKRELFLKSLFGLVEAFVCPSRFLAERYVAWGLPKERVRVLENGQRIEVVAPPRAVARQRGRRNRFGFFGQITEFKGIHVLLDAVSRVPEADWGEDSALLVFGDNLENQPEQFQEEFQRLLDRAGRRARLYGSYKAPELPMLMREVDWVVVPSIWWENSPMVIQEAFCHGRPVICSNIGGMAEKVTHNATGLHFRQGSVEDLVDRLVEAIRSPDLWKRLRANLPTPPSHVEAAARHLDLYRDLIDQRTGGLRKAAPKALVAS